MSPRNKYHLGIIEKIKSYSHNATPDTIGFGLKYVGTNKPSYHLNTKDTQGIANDFLKKNKLSIQELHILLESLYSGQSYDEINIGAKIIQYSKDLRQEIGLQDLDNWLGKVHGWAEVDTLCQMAFTDEDILSRWSEWQKFLLQLSKDDNVHKRRASLVLLTKPVRLSPDDRLSNVAFKNIGRLRKEKDILITKAVSWLLRALIKNHKAEVTQYLKENMDSLPKIAFREVSSKLETGKKYINKKKQNEHPKI
jgi:3-methyladenine DNA glycosylase AlkD